MRIINKIIPGALLGSVLLGYIFWQFLRPVEIVAVHQRNGNFSAVLVKNFPFTDKGKITWWMKNKDSLKKSIISPALRYRAIFSLRSATMVTAIKKRVSTTDSVLTI